MSETGKRIISGAGIALFTVFTLVYYDFYYSILPLLLIGSVGVLGVIEFYMLVDRGLEGRPARWTGGVFALLLVLALYLELLARRGIFLFKDHGDIAQILHTILQGNGNAVFFVMVMALLFVMVSILIYHPLDGSIYAMGVTVLGLLYIPIGSGHALLYMVSDTGIFYIVFLTLATTMTDIGAYFAGKYLGRHNAGLTVSPRKTYEGYLGGYVGANLSIHLYVFFWSGSSINLPGPLEVTILGIAISTLSILGDLVESAIKRDARKKDSASLIPGHGGILDLADALFFTVPAFYYYLQFRGVFAPL